MADENSNNGETGSNNGETSPEEKQDAPPEEGSKDAEGREKEPEGDQGRASREAARYRTRLRESEARSGELETRLTGYQVGAAERFAAESLSKPSDLWLDGATLEDLLDDYGQVDVDAVASAVEGVLDGREQLAKGYNPNADYGAGKRTSVNSGSGWQGVIKGR